MPTHFHHEKLNVYQRAIEFAAWSEELLQSIQQKAAAKEHLGRSSMSVPINIAEGNAKWSPDERAYYIETAIGSALECAACLDVLGVKELVTVGQRDDGKSQLHAVVSMLYGLRRSKADTVAEDAAPYGKPPAEGQVYFPHESLDVYRSALDFVNWCHLLGQSKGTGAEIRDTLDRSATSVVLNIAEGNAKYSQRDRGRFIGIAATSSLRCAAVLDVLAVKGRADVDYVGEGKLLLSRIVQMLGGMRRSVLPPRSSS